MNKLNICVHSFYSYNFDFIRYTSANTKSQYQFHVFFYRYIIMHLSNIYEEIGVSTS